MYEWLDAALDGDSHLLTANRRLARTLTAEFNARQQGRGLMAWPTAPIRFWRDWLGRLAETGPDVLRGRVRINASQARVLWEQILARELDDPLLNRGAFARQVRDARDRLHEWHVPLDACAQHARSRDHHLFVRASKRYAAVLEEQGWLDGAAFPERAISAVRAGWPDLPRRVYLAGFDRQTPRLGAFAGALEAAGVDVVRVDAPRRPGLLQLLRYETEEAELRAAGHWARACLAANPAARIGIVVPGLDRDGTRLAGLVAEGLLPGWQLGGATAAGAVNVSLGRRLADFPAIRIATLLADWLHRDLSSAEVSMLLCSPFLGHRDLDARCRFDARLRRRPWQHWAPGAFSAVLPREAAGRLGLAHWASALEALAQRRRSAAERAAPVAWARDIDALLADFGWPGRGELDSTGFQLVNRWRELLNELTQLELVSGAMTAGEACRRIATMAGETVFQPESAGARVQLLGPLEAAGLEFDQLRITGLTAADWPPPARPLALVARDLQRERDMPDATPEDTLRYARRVLARLAASAPQVTVTFPRFRGDAEQVQCGLISAYGPEPGEGTDDPGWAAARHGGAVSLAVCSDPAPPLGSDETVRGGAATIQRQLVEPFAAFVHGRLGLRPLTRLEPGLRAWYRGNLLHEALRHLYAGVGSQADIAAWSDAHTEAQVTAAVERAFRPQHRHADALLGRLLRREEQRAAALVARVVAVDRDRPAFAIDRLEHTLQATLGAVRLELRIDRIDRHADGSLLIWDYKTGRGRKFVGRNAEPDDFQLVVYACAMDQPIRGLGYFNVDSRDVSISAAGPDFTPALDWGPVLDGWRDTVFAAAAALADGDVSINTAASVTAARPLALLSRYTELLREL